MDKKKHFKKKAKKAVIAVTAATSLFVNNAYDNPLEFIDDTNTDSSFEEASEETKKSSLKMRFRLLMGQVPLPIRACVLMPLWCLGWLIMAIINPIWQYLIYPHLASITHWAVILALVLGIIVIGASIIFPNLPIKKILNKKTFILTLVLVTILAICDKIATEYTPDYQKFKDWVKFTGCIITTIIVIIDIYFRNRKTKITVSTDKYEFKNEN